MPPRVTRIANSREHGQRHRNYEDGTRHERLISEQLSAPV